MVVIAVLHVKLCWLSHDIAWLWYVNHALVNATGQIALGYRKWQKLEISNSSLSYGKIVIFIAFQISYQGQRRWYYWLGLPDTFNKVFKSNSITALNMCFLILTQLTGAGVRVCFVSLGSAVFAILSLLTFIQCFFYVPPCYNRLKLCIFYDKACTYEIIIAEILHTLLEIVMLWAWNISI